MTTDFAAAPLTVAEGPTDEELLYKYRPVFERIAEGALERETSGRLALEEAGWLREVGFPAVRCGCRESSAATARVYVNFTYSSWSWLRRNPICRTPFGSTRDSSRTAGENATPSAGSSGSAASVTG